MAKIRMSAKNTGDTTKVKVILTHPMESGSRKNKKTGELIPAHFIQSLVCESAGKVCFSADLSGGISVNPMIAFKFKGKKGDTVKINWVDNQGGTGTGEKTIK